ncbi:MAG: hypothetical protein P5697_19745 [Limnospira sp. PMC 1256.20]|uniref:hypothetical protein n=1 Tax=unclassified Limnospira TaxID=2642885 RepID=UPI0028E17A61|nr:MULTISPECIES: hypothetical protein [unclassified Limnospira]MDT9215698.1 hypothetical protein [Limnospira sp. PMC 1256.20]MDT9241206.1 hypothetical protein [Limnospira sp. PMC 1261.20]
MPLRDKSRSFQPSQEFYVKITVETLFAPKDTPKTFLQTAQSLQLQGKPDWSENIDQYLYGNSITEDD